VKRSFNSTDVHSSAAPTLGSSWAVMRRCWCGCGMRSAARSNGGSVKQCDRPARLGHGGPQRRWDERNTGHAIRDVQRRVQHPVIGWMAATLDGVVEGSHRSSETIGAIASALAKAQGELSNPEKSLIATIRSAFPREGIGPSATLRSPAGSTSCTRASASMRSQRVRPPPSTTPQARLIETFQSLRTLSTSSRQAAPKTPICSGDFECYSSACS
jgi:hypothetical protein